MHYNTQKKDRYIRMKKILNNMHQNSKPKMFLQIIYRTEELPFQNFNICFPFEIIGFSIHFQYHLILSCFLLQLSQENQMNSFIISTTNPKF